MTHPDIRWRAGNDLAYILTFQKKPPTSKAELNWVKDKAFHYRCRNKDVQKMIDDLVEPMRLAYITERLLS